MQGYVGHHLACDKFLRETTMPDFPLSIQKIGQAGTEGQFWPIAIFREPVARVVSAYRHNLREVYKVLSFGLETASGDKFTLPFL